LIAIGLAVHILNSDITFNKPEGYFYNVINACILISSISLATIYAILTILENRKTQTSLDWAFVSFIPLISVASGLIGLAISPFSDYWAKLILSVTLFTTIFGLGIVYTIMFELYSIKKEK
jgi:hypothetical protein